MVGAVAKGSGDGSRGMLMVVVAVDVVCACRGEYDFFN